MNELTVVYATHRAVLQPGQLAVIGRHPTSAIVVDDPRVSREHLRLSWGAQGWVMENLGGSGTYIAGQQVAQYYLSQAIEVRLAAPDGPLIRFEPDRTTDAQATVAGFAPLPPAAGGVNPSGGVAAARVAPVSSLERVAAFKMLLPIRSWIKDPMLRSWYRILVAVYAMVPLIFLAGFAHSSNVSDMGWAYCLYVAPLWAIVFWYLIKPGPILKLDVVLGAFVIGAVLLLIPAITLPWERRIAPPTSSHDLISWIYGVGYAEEVTKAIPIIGLAMIVLYGLHKKLDVRMWMLLGTVSGLIFGVYEASTVYVPVDVSLIAKAGPVFILAFAERVFVDGFQHSVWAGISAFFIGLGTNYPRQRIPLWVFGITLAAVLHGLSDWSTTEWTSLWPWIGIQAFSLFLFLGYTVSAASIEKEVRHTPLFRGESIYLDPSRQAQAAPPGP